MKRNLNVTDNSQKLYMKCIFCSATQEIRCIHIKPVCRGFRCSHDSIRTFIYTQIVLTFLFTCFYTGHENIFTSLLFIPHSLIMHINMLQKFIQMSHIVQPIFLYCLPCFYNMLTAANRN